MYKTNENEDSGLIEHISNPSLPTYRSRLRISLMCWSIAMAMFQYGYWMVQIQQLDIEMLKPLYSIDLTSSTATGLLNGCMPIGALFGALFSSVLINNFSRRSSLLMTNIFALIIGGLIYIPNFPLMVACRLSQGIIAGIYCSITPLMIRQLAPKEIAGQLGSYVQINICTGAAFGCTFAYVLQKITGDQTGSEYYKILFAFPELMVLSQTLILIFVFPYETPKYLLSQGKDQQAKTLLQVIYKPEYMEEIFQEKRLDLESLRQRQNGQQESPPSKKPRIQAFIAINCALLQQLSGVNAVVVYAGKDVKSAVSGEITKLMPILINFDQLIATFIVSFLLAKYGRRTILLIGTSIEIIANGLIATGFLIKDQHEIGTVFIFCGMFLFMTDFGLSLGAVTWLYLSEIAQPKFMPIPITMNWLGASIVVLLFPIVTDNLLGGNPAMLFFIFMAWCTGAVILNYFFLIETKGKTQKEIREQFEAIKVC